MQDQPLIIKRYGEIIPNLKQFEKIIREPLPACFWTNPLKTTAFDLQKLLQQKHFKLEPLSWNDGAFRCYSQHTLGTTWEYLVGLLQIQEEVSMLPGILLHLHPSDRVLD